MLSLIILRNYLPNVQQKPQKSTEILGIIRKHNDHRHHLAATQKLGALSLLTTAYRPGLCPASENRLREYDFTGEAAAL